MTQITFYKTTAGEYQGFTCAGHAGYANYGEDIVCASISVLVINTINSLEEITAEKINVETDKDRGVIRCRFVDRTLKETSRVLVDSLVLGLTQIEKQYGKNYCKLTFEEV
ncbi:MAG: ribosomal-processing cysteine protease Prp [Lachnospiraceae bacterium]|nr:ribosomal-processing cysteine protease Prp [Lachnospiraceae bacterium]